MVQPRNVLKNLRVKDFLKVGGSMYDVFTNSAERYALVENFKQLPDANASVGVARNLDFEILGTNADIADFSWDTVRGGVKFVTGAADNDQVIVLPHLDAKQTAWTGVKFGTENQVVWEAMITAGDDVATGVLYWAGLKLTNTPVIATDANQVFFRFSTDDSDTTFRCISSIAGTDTNADSGVTVTAGSEYKLRIEIDGDRKAHFFINDKEVEQTAALTNDVDFIPYIGIQALSAAAEHVIVHYEKISRILFE